MNPMETRYFVALRRWWPTWYAVIWVRYGGGQPEILGEVAAWRRKTALAQAEDVIARLRRMDDQLAENLEATRPPEWS